MAITSGFFNSVNHDRAYDALQFSSVFDGLINDGVFMSIGGRFLVKAASGMTVNVDTGRAWFDHSWILSDALYPLTFDVEASPLDRWDAVVIETNWEETVRANSIRIVKGTPSSDPQRPTLTKSTYVNQYPLAYVKIKAGEEEVRQANIMNAVGTIETPFVTGIVDTIDIDDLLAQWAAEWADWSTTFREYMVNWREEETTAFNVWFASIQSILDDNVAARLSAEIASLERRKANKSTSINYTIEASKWNGNEYSFEDEYPSSQYNLEVQVSSAASQIQIDFWSEGEILSKSDMTNIMVAKGIVPKSDIPAIITITER